MIIENIFKMVIPENLTKDPVEYAYTKNLVGACIISVFASPLFAFLYFQIQAYQASYSVLIAEVIFLSSLLILKWTNSLFIASTIFITTLICILTWLTYILGGIFSSPAYWLILPPLVAVFIGGLRAGYFWSFISIVCVTTIYVLQHLKFHFPVSPVTNPLLLQFFAITGLNLVIIWLVYFYEVGKITSIDQLAYMAYHDILTDLPNRIGYEERLKNTIEKVRLEQTSFLVIGFNIDNFNKTNQVFGHHIGDFLLKEIARRIKRFIRETDTMARVGGDEFKIIFEGNQNEDMIKELANTILIALKCPFNVLKHEVNVTASMGVAEYPASSVGSYPIDRYVDIALAKSRSLGGNNIQYFTETLAQEEALRLEIERMLPNAIMNDELYLNFQPQFDRVNSKKITGLEALLRWNNKVLGDVQSDVFVPIAERINTISQLGEWVFRSACHQYMNWYHKGLIDKNLSLAINISVHQLYDVNFLPFVEQIIEETGIPPRNLEFELTETVIITDKLYAISILQKLYEMGIHTVIDDFGVGHTSLSYLVTLPVTGLKVDKSFLHNLGNKNSFSLVDSLIDLAHTINLKVTVEGVENIEQFNYLKNTRCDNLQGYYLSKPLDVMQAQILLESSRQAE